MASDKELILRSSAKPVARVEIARSFSYKLNCANYGGAQYESHDFFCSEKAECAIEDEEQVSEALHQFCRAEVKRAVKDYVAGLRQRKGEAA